MDKSENAPPGSLQRMVRPTPIRRAEIFWVDVLDHLPDEGITVLVATPEGEVSIGYLDEGQWCDCQMAGGGLEVSHWSDLPDAPTVRSNDPSSATRRTGRNDCNRDAPAGFAAAHG